MFNPTLTFPFVDLHVRLRPERLDRLVREDRRSRQTMCRETIIREVTGWLSRAHDTTAGKGIAGFYHLQTGWATACPEATAAAIPTMLSLIEKNPQGDLAERATRLGAAQVLRDFVDHRSHSITITSADALAVARAILGWTALYQQLSEERFKTAAGEAGSQLVKNHDNRSQSIAPAPVAQAMVAWALLQLYRFWPDQQFRATATAYSDRVVESISSDGYLHGCFHTVTADPSLIHIAQGLCGLLEAGILTGEQRWIEAAQCGARQLMKLFQSKGALAGRNGPGRRANHSFSCMAGCAQTALLWLRLHQNGWSDGFFEAAVRLNQFIASTVDITNPDPGIRGGIRAGYPLWVDYRPLTYSALAAKLALDAFLLEEKPTGPQTSSRKLRFVKPKSRENT